MKSKITCRGHVIIGTKIRPDLRILEVVKKFPVPRKVKGWPKKAEIIFKKEKLCERSVMIHLDYSQHYILSTDTFGFHVIGILSQGLINEPEVAPTDQDRKDHEANKENIKGGLEKSKKGIQEINSQQLRSSMYCDKGRKTQGGSIRTKKLRGKDIDDHTTNTSQVQEDKSTISRT